MDKKIRVGINGFGRIGRSFFRFAHARSELEVVAVNDLGDLENLAYLLRYDTVYGKSDFEVKVKTEGKPAMLINEHEVAFLSEKEPEKIPWGENGVDIVVESTGVFTSYEKAKAHLAGGAKRVVVTAPMKDKPSGDISGATVLIGINENLLENASISSNASCTTNAAAPIVQILHESIGIEKAVLNTVHGYTASQQLVDAPSKRDFRGGRAAAQNIVPSSTGAAIATTEAITDLVGKFDGISMRVPVISGSIADITFIAKRDTSAEEVNNILRQAAREDRWKKVFTITEEPIVSSDILGEPYASIADLEMTRVVGGNLVKVCAWYDNESGYVHALIEHVIASGRYLS